MQDKNTSIRTTMSLTKDAYAKIVALSKSMKVPLGKATSIMVESINMQKKVNERSSIKKSEIGLPLLETKNGKTITIEDVWSLDDE